MKTIPDETTCLLFMQENTSWQKTIRAQVSEIPQWKDMLMAGTNKVDTGNGEILYSQLYHQQLQMTKLDEDIKQQQERLEKNCELNHHDDIESFCMQDILRERIKIVEKTYIDLKCNFLNYLSKRA